MVHLTSNFQTTEELEAALVAMGDLPPVELPGDKKPASEEKPSEQAEKPGESAAAPAGESAPVPETGEKKPQETQAAKPDQNEKPAEPKHGDRPSRGNFKSRMEKAEERVSRALEDLDLERGDKQRLKAELEAAKTELAKFAGTKTEEPAKDAGPVRPKRPTLEGCDFDQAKYEAALDTYDEQLSTYHRDVAKKEANDLIAADRQRAQDEQRQQEISRLATEFQGRVQADVAHFEDWKELVDAMPAEPVVIGGAVEGAIEASEHPADLIRYFMLDYLDNDGKEIAKFEAMDPVRQVRNIALLEKRLVEERTAARKPAAEPAKPEPKTATAVATEKPPEAPARPRTARKPADEPIEPVGSRAGARQPSLEDATNIREFAKLRAQGVNR